MVGLSDKLLVEALQCRPRYPSPWAPMFRPSGLRGAHPLPWSTLPQDPPKSAELVAVSDTKRSKCSIDGVCKIVCVSSRGPVCSRLLVTEFERVWPNRIPGIPTGPSYKLGIVLCVFSVRVSGKFIYVPILWALFENMHLLLQYCGLHLFISSQTKPYAILIPSITNTLQTYGMVFDVFRNIWISSHGKN